MSTTSTPTDACPSRLPPVFSSYQDDTTGPRITADEVHDAYAVLGLRPSISDWLPNKGCCWPFTALWLAGKAEGVLESTFPRDYGQVTLQAMNWAIEKFGKKYCDGFRGAWYRPDVERRRLEETNDRSWCRRVDEGAEDGWRAAFRCD